MYKRISYVFGHDRNLLFYDYDILYYSLITRQFKVTYFFLYILFLICFVFYFLLRLTLYFHRKITINVENLLYPVGSKTRQIVRFQRHVHLTNKLFIIFISYSITELSKLNKLRVFSLSVCILLYARV